MNVHSRVVPALAFLTVLVASFPSDVDPRSASSLSDSWGLIARADAQVADAGDLVDAPAAAVDAGVGSGSGSSAGSGSGGGTMDALDSIRLSYLEIRAKYDALKGEKDDAARMLLWAALFAGVLKILLDLVKLVGSRALKESMAWIALGLAVPIALLTRYAGGHGWVDSLIFAGSGPGAIVVHELISFFQKKK